MSKVGGWVGGWEERRTFGTELLLWYYMVRWAGGWEDERTGPELLEELLHRGEVPVDVVLNQVLEFIEGLGAQKGTQGDVVGLVHRHVETVYRGRVGGWMDQSKRTRHGLVHGHIKDVLFG